jgi:hypothetical protein
MQRQVDHGRCGQTLKQRVSGFEETAREITRMRLPHQVLGQCANDRRKPHIGALLPRNPPVQRGQIGPRVESDHEVPAEAEHPAGRKGTACKGQPVVERFPRERRAQ